MRRNRSSWPPKTGQTKSSQSGVANLRNKIHPFQPDPKWPTGGVREEDGTIARELSGRLKGAFKAVFEMLKESNERRNAVKELSSLAGNEV